jgi:ubiquinone/menaquinone biosynthesis C-methylase UbiE
VNRIEFQDYFSRLSADYARFRPTYPPALFDLVARYAPGRDCAWDCATGSGQAAIGLIRHFRRVIATDASAQQIEHATPVSNIDYRVAPAEASGLEDASVDVVTVAQALQWFDRDRFYAEVRRVCRPGGILAVWSYYGLSISFSPEVDAVMREVDDVLMNYWPPAYDEIKSSFRDHDAYFSVLGFPFATLPTPPVELVVHWDLSQLLGALTTASATQQCLASGGQARLAALYQRLSRAWGDPAATRTGADRLALRLGRVP